MDKLAMLERLTCLKNPSAATNLTSHSQTRLMMVMIYDDEGNDVVVMCSCSECPEKMMLSGERGCVMCDCL
eukprot:9491386-Pyramimonas_sp.AAC.1